MKGMLHPLSYSVHTRLREFHLKRMLPALAQARLLDVGCGLGYLTETVGKGGLRIGMDYDFHSLKANCDRGVVRNMVQGHAVHLPFQSQSFDVVLCSEMLEHLPDGLDVQSLAEIARVLKPGGQVLITVPALEGLRAHSVLRNAGHDDPSGGEYHYRRGYSWQEMTTLIQRVPQLRIKTTRYAMFLLAELFMDLLKWVYLKKHQFKEHSDMMGMQDSLLFRVYRFLFPALYGVFICEDLLIASVLKGHILIVALERI